MFRNIELKYVFLALLPKKKDRLRKAQLTYGRECLLNIKMRILKNQLLRRKEVNLSFTHVVFISRYLKKKKIPAEVVPFRKKEKC